MKIFNIILKVVLCLLMVSPILGSLGIFPEPTADMYNTPEAWGFISALYSAKYIMYIMSVVFALALGLVISGRTAAAVLLILPVTVNIVGFHAFLDGGIFTAGAVMADILFILNIYFLWKYREVYKALCVKS